MEFEVLSNSLSLDVRVQAETLRRGKQREFNEVIFYKNVDRVKGNQKWMVIPHGWQPLSQEWQGKE